jgi:hypothetical protein
MGNGIGKRAMKCETCTENDKGVAGKGSRSVGCRGTEHGQTCNEHHNHAVAVRAALKSAVKLGEAT